VDSKDDRNPSTDSYSFTISQKVPWSSLVEIAYVGNQTRDIANATGYGSNINLIPLGAMLSSRNGGVDPASLTSRNFRPLQGFDDINIATNNLYANYNALQVKWMRSKGRGYFMANYTYGKAMGIVLNGSSMLDPFNLSNNYGVQASNRPQIFNVAYSYVLGKYSRNKILGGLANSWQFSGIVQAQSGANLTGQWGQVFGMNLNNGKLPGTTYNISSTSLLGTPSIALTPILTCDPRSNLAPHQFINASCFSFPNQVGQNGPTTLPVMYGPAYWNADLGIWKNFTVYKERYKLQFRMDGYNFLNHPLWSFNNTNRTLGFDAAGKLNTPLFGTVTTKQGHRIVKFAVNFTF